MKTLILICFSIAVAIGSTHGQTLLTETTWGGAGSDVAEGVASAADGSSYVVGITDSFTTDEFGIPSPKIFLVKFAPNGSLSCRGSGMGRRSTGSAGLTSRSAQTARST